MNEYILNLGIMKEFGFIVDVHSKPGWFGVCLINRRATKKFRSTAASNRFHKIYLTNIVIIITIRICNFNRNS